MIFEVYIQDDIQETVIFLKRGFELSFKMIWNVCSEGGVWNDLLEVQNKFSAESILTLESLN